MLTECATPESSARCALLETISRSCAKLNYEARCCFFTHEVRGPKGNLEVLRKAAEKLRKCCIEMLY